MTSKLPGLLLPTIMAFQAQAYDLEIHGSNTVGATLAPMLVTGYLEEHGGGQVTSRGTGVENEKVLRTAVNNRATEVLVAAHGSSTGFKALAAGKAHIWASSRTVKPQEAEQFRARADLNAPESEHVIAIDGLAILVHPSNPVSQMSIETLGRVFSGQIRNWSELGGPDSPHSTLRQGRPFRDLGHLQIPGTGERVRTGQHRQALRIQRPAIR